MSRSIKIDGDFSGVKKGIMEISKEMKGLSKKQGVSLFSKEDAALLSRQTLDVTKSLQAELDKINKNADRYKKAIKATNISEKKRVQAAKKYNALLKDRATIQKSLNKVQDFDQSIKGPSKMGQLKGGLGRGASRIPGVGGMLGRMGGLGLMGGLGMMGGAALGFGAYKGYAGYQQYKGGAAQRLRMQGKGINETSGANKGLAGLGYSVEDVRNQQEGASRTFGAGNADQNGVLQRAQFERAKGLDKGALTEAASGMRMSAGGDKAQEAMFKLQATILGKQLTGDLGPFLETSAQMLTSMNENGIPADGEILALMGAFVKGGTPEGRAMQQIMGADAAMKNSSGDTNALWQSMLGEAGIGGGSVGGTQERIRHGIFGADAGKAANMGLKPEDIQYYKDQGVMGEGTGSQDVLKALIQKSDDMFGAGPEQNLAKGEFFMQQLGTKSGMETIGLMNRFQEAIKSNDPKEMKKVEEDLKKAAMSPEMRMQSDIKDSLANMEGIDNDMLAHAGRQSLALEMIGANVAPLGEAANEMLSSIDEGIAHIAGFFGGYTSKAEMAKERNAETDAGLSGHDLSREKISMMSAEEAKAKAAEVQQQNWDLSAAPMPMKKGLFGESVDQEAAMQQTQTKEINGRIIQLLERQAAAAEKLVGNTKKGPKIKTKSSTTIGDN